MAFAFLTAEALHVRSVGLHYLLMPEDCPLSPAAEPQRRQAPQRPHVQPALRQGWQRPQQAGGGQPYAARRQQPAAQTPATQPYRPQAHTQAPRPQPQQRSARQPQAGWTQTWPDNWAEDWQQLLRRTKPGRVGWTYYGLGHDLCGTPNLQRRQRLQDLIKFLSMPAGTHTFWPVGLPARDEDGNSILVPCPDIFWEAMARLGTRVLIVMGSPAARAIGITGHIQPLFSPMQAFHGVRVLITRDIDGLDDEGYMSGTRNFLRTMLTKLL